MMVELIGRKIQLTRHPLLRIDATMGIDEIETADDDFAALLDEIYIDIGGSE